MDQLSRMKIFTRVAELQNFTLAAEQLRLPKATVSTAIQELEAHMGARLLQRTTRQVQITDEGRSYLERCKELLSDLEESENMFRSKPEQIKGKIRVDMSVSLAAQTFMSILPKFLEKYPQIEFELSSSDRAIDLVRDGVDCVVRAGNQSQPGTIEKVIGSASVINCASPKYLKEYGTPKSLDDLKNHKVIYYSQTLGGKRYGFEFFDGKVFQELKMPGAITVNNTEAYRAACVAGLGIAQFPQHGIGRLLQDGNLVEILPKLKAEPMVIKLVYPQRRFVADRVRVFMSWLETEMKALLK